MIYKNSFVSSTLCPRLFLPPLLVVGPSLTAPISEHNLMLKKTSL